MKVNDVQWSFNLFRYQHKIDISFSLAGIAQWIEHRPVNQGVAGSIPSLGHMPGLQAGSLLGGT